MRYRHYRLIAAALGCALLLCGCNTGGADSGTASQETTEAPPIVISAPEDKVYIFESNAPVFSLEDNFYNADLSVELRTAHASEIYYTTDGTEPDRNATLYTEPLYFACEDTDYPTAHTVRAKAYYSDGTESAVSVHTYFAAKGATERFSEYVLSISGDPAEITEGPDGIFYGENAMLRGREAEREVHLTAWAPNGEVILSQYCGMRTYGNASRYNSIKSMKLYARKSYGDDAGIGAFHTDLFQTPLADGSGLCIDEYDKLVLRNSGNDFQFAYIRDELCQVLAAEAGFADYEAVVPAVCYLNGEYYGLFWLHESYCDDYFKDKYPNAAALGEFIICEGTDVEKDVEEDDADAVYAEEFNAMYAKYADSDLTDGTVYAELCALLDVENYLDYFAFNIYLNNRDWPQNNLRCYRYVPAEGEAPGEGVYDGKWRFLVHDMDYSMGMYEQPEVMAGYDNLSHITTAGDERYSPLFTALMEREECRGYFADKIREYADGVLDGEHMAEVCATLNGSRYLEQLKYYGHLANLRNAGDESIWTDAGHLGGQMAIVTNFAKTRETYMLGYLEEFLAGYEARPEEGTEGTSGE